MLTELHQKAFAENIKLVTWLCQRYKCPIGMEYEDWWQEVAVCVLQAIAWHEPEKGQLSTLAAKLVWNRYSCLRDKLRKDNVLNQLSVDYANSEGASLADLITDKSHQPSLDDTETVQQILDSLSPKNVEICQGVSHGKSWREIGEGVGLSGEACRQSFGRIRKALNPESVGVEALKSCEVCERMIIATKATASLKYCKACKITVEREQHRESKRRFALRRKGQVVA